MNIAQHIKLRCVLEQNKELVNYNGQISHLHVHGSVHDGPALTHLQTAHPLLDLHPHFISSLQAVAASEIVIHSGTQLCSLCLVQPHPSGEGTF